jgi:antitoxin (DNA-binding transcriptional repressor) of toxin-antitoxin stability system
MLVTTYSDARKNFASILDRAGRDGAVLVKRADGSVYRIVPEKQGKSPFDGVKPVVKAARGTAASVMDELRSSRG